MNGYRRSPNHKVHLFEECSDNQKPAPLERVELIHVAHGGYRMLVRSVGTPWRIKAAITVAVCTHCEARRRAAA